jgi:hypothetical protein
MPGKVPVEKYLENIQTKTGKNVAAFKKRAIAKGYFEKGQDERVSEGGGSHCLAQKRF